jgi:HAD superfamily hydrolase (TIGR01509 family)
MGHFMGLFDQPFIGIPPHHKIAMVRYAEFHKLEEGQINETALFIDLLHLMAQGGIMPRAGVAECISKCKERGLPICFLTTTTQNNIDILSSALGNNIDFNVFDLITTKADVVAEKPSGEVYRYALDKFGLAAHDVIAVEDTEANQAAALQEDILCYLFAGEYASTQHNLNSVNSLTVIASQL